ncbi:MAG: hypothetical protein DI556_04765 [Rhodovulum sulfidophilum]|uniref:Uncharacterized protein n=1 Tax=Rhodovulum sulfidophilum TaxID=35806 RepID=A0A2W5ND66_RHOSU|nr:MAG: hypothetical protein DI556_04765 [Rhodovulum sulfidophilum]
MALARRGGEGELAAPQDPRIAWAREELPARPGFSWPEKPKSAFVPPFALSRDATPAPAVTPAPAIAPAPAEPAPRAPRAAVAARLGALRATLPDAHAALDQVLGFGRAHLMPILGSFLVAGLGLGAAALLLSPGAEPVAPVAEVAAPLPEASAAPAPEPVASLPPEAEARPVLAAVEPPAAAAADEVELDLTATSVPDLTSEQIAALEPTAAAPAALATEYFAPRPRPRPAGVAQTSPGLAATGDAATAAVAARFPATRVVINYPANTPAAEVTAATESITAAGFPNTQSARVNVDMSAANVRYFHAADAEAARALAEATGAVARDFTSFSPPPRTGHLELWLPGTAPKRAPAPEDQILGILRDRAAQN